MRSMWVVAAALVLVGAGQARADMSAAETKRLSEAAAVLSELRNTPDNDIPNALWSKAECVVVIPNLKKGAFIFGGEYGKGVMSCRHGDAWSSPAFVEMEKGSWGFQAGAQQIDLVMLVMNRRGVDKLLQDKVTLGADASVAAGPVGRSTAASTDAQMHAEVLSWSRAQGVFAGIDISGGALRPDADANHDAYGSSASARDIVFAGGHPAPAAAAAFLRTLQQSAGTAARR